MKKANIHSYRKEADNYDASIRTSYRYPEIDVERLKPYGIEDGIHGIALEIGAGTGYARAASNNIIGNCIWVATDISLEMLKKYKSKDAGSIFVVADVEYLPFKNNVISCLVGSSILHHLPSDGFLLREAYRVLKSGGAFFLLREPNMQGCDFWMRIHHLARRYGDRSGLWLLLKRAFSGPGAIKKIWSYEMEKESFLQLDLQEIRGAILQATPTKKRGGIGPGKLTKEAKIYFYEVNLIGFGLIAEVIEFISLLFNIKIHKNIRKGVDIFDRSLFHLASDLPFSALAMVMKHPRK